MCDRGTLGFDGTQIIIIIKRTLLIEVWWAWNSHQPEGTSRLISQHGCKTKCLKNYGRTANGWRTVFLVDACMTVCVANTPTHSWYDSSKSVSKLRMKRSEWTLPSNGRERTPSYTRDHANIPMNIVNLRIVQWSFIPPSLFPISQISIDRMANGQEKSTMVNDQC